MLSWAIGFFILALVAAFFGFGGIASSAAGIAKVLLVLFVIGFIVSLLLARPGRRHAPRPVLDLEEQRLQRARPPLRAPVPVDLGIEARALG